MAPQLTRKNGPGRSPRSLVDRPGDHFLARPGLAQNQHRRIRAHDQLDLVHHRLETGVCPDDRVADVVPAQPRQERHLVGFERLAERDQLAQPAVVLQQRPQTAPRAYWTSSACSSRSLVPGDSIRISTPAGARRR